MVCKAVDMITRHFVGEEEDLCSCELTTEHGLCSQLAVCTTLPGCLVLCILDFIDFFLHWRREQ